MVEIGVNIKSHDNNSLYNQGQGPGLLVAIKTANFFGMGSTLDAAVSEAHEKMTAFLASEAIKIGSEGSPDRPTNLGNLRSVPPSREQ